MVICLSIFTEQLTDDVVVWPAQNGQAVYGVLIVKESWLASRKDAIERFLRSLSQAEKYLAERPEEAKTIVRKRLKYDRSYMEGVWPRHRFSLSLDFSLLVAMNDEALWAIKNNPAAGERVPDFKRRLYLDGLKAVKPSAVNIAR